MRIAVVLLTSACTALALHRRSRRERARLAARIAELDAALAAARLRSERTRIAPHLLLNALNSVAVLAEEERAPRARDAVTRLAGLMRSALDQHTPLVTVAREIEFLQRYLAVERVRFGDRLLIRWDVADACMSAQIPALLLQPLVENAIRHGRSPRSGDVDVTVGGRLADGRVTLWVADRGPGLHAHGRTGIGLGTTRRQLELLFAGRYTLDISQREVDGVEVRISLPHIVNGNGRHDDQDTAGG